MHTFAKNRNKRTVRLLISLVDPQSIIINMSCTCWIKSSVVRDIISCKIDIYTLPINVYNQLSNRDAIKYIGNLLCSHLATICS